MREDGGCMIGEKFDIRNGSELVVQLKVEQVNKGGD